MIEKEFPVFAFEERRRFGVSQEQFKLELNLLEEFLEIQKIERKPKSSIFNLFVSLQISLYRRYNSSFYQIILHKNYVLLELLIEYNEY